MREHVPSRVSDTAVDDLVDRLRLYRAVTRPALGHDVGVDEQLLTETLRHWADAHDWRAHERRIAGWGWQETEDTAVPIRAVVRAADRLDAPVVLFLHGWPDSVLRFEHVFPLVSDLTVVAPALPGFPFAAPVEPGGLSAVAMADAVAAAMAEFGYDQYVVSAGDVGCDVAEALAARHGSHVTALHLTDLSQYHFLVDLPTDLDDAEQAYVERGHTWQQRSGGYMHEQSTRPHTLAVGLGDSPAGLAAWILEKLVEWTDGDGDGRAGAFPLDDAVTWIAAYWYTGAIGTSFTPYATPAEKDWPRIEVPTVMTVFPADLVNAPRQFVERFFAVVEWIEFPRGGHFAAWERPDQYVEGVRRAIAVAGDDSD